MPETEMQLPRKNYGLVIVTIAFLLAFASANLPVPLYAQLQQAHPAITDAHISLTMFTYLIGVVTMLLFSGKVSDAIGRKPLTITGMLLGSITSLMFLTVSNAATLLAMRFFQGIACGLAMSPISAYIIDLSGAKHATLARTIVGTFAMLGVAFGSVGIGIWNVFTPNYASAFHAMAITQLVCTICILFSPETVSKQNRIPLKSVWRSPIAIPKEVRPLFPIASIAYVAAWGVGTYFQAFSALVASNLFGDTGTLLGAVILMLSMCPSALGGPIEARMPKGTSLKVGLALFAASTIAMCLFLQMHMLAASLISISVFSLSMGIALAASLRVLYAAAPNASNSAIISSINLIAYVGCAVLNIGMSIIVNDLGLIYTLILLSAVCVIPCLLCIGKISAR